MKRSVFLFIMILLVGQAPAAEDGSEISRLEKIAENRPLEAQALARELLPKAKNEFSRARILNAEALSCTISNDFARALASAAEAEAIAEKNKFPEQLAYALLHQATVNWRLSNLDRAYDQAVRSMEIFDKTGDLWGRMMSAMRVAAILTEVENFDRALELSDHCLDLARKLNDKGDLSRILNNRAYIFYREKDYSNMLRFALQAIENREIRYAMINAGVAHLELGNFREAEKFLKQGIRMSQEGKDRIQELVGWKFLARAHKNLGDPQLARTEALKALELARQVNNRFEVRNVCLELSEICDLLDDHVSAYHYLTEATALQEELQTKALNEKITRARQRYEIGQKETQIKLLRQEKTIAELKARQQRNLLSYLSAITLILLIAAFLTFRAFLMKKKANRAVSETNSELQAIDKIVKNINKEVELPKLIDSIYGHTLTLLPQAEKGGFLVYSEEARAFQLLVHYGYEPGEADRVVLSPEAATARYKENAAPMAPGITLAKNPADIFAQDGPGREVLRPKAILALELEIEGRTLGYMIFLNTRDPDAFRGSDIQKLVRVREHLISAFTKARTIQRLEEATRTDPLTGLLNRRGMMERLQGGVEQFKRYGQPFTIAIGDLDDFKKINDAFGHECGDMALRHAAALIGGNLRKVDSAGRWGGEEFLVLMPQTGEASALAAVEKLRALVAGGQLAYKGRAIAMTMTFGISEFGAMLSLDAFLNRADAALYEGKRRGKDRVVAASELA